MSRFLRPNIAEMQGYAYGEQPQDPADLKLNTNENPYPPSPEVARLLQKLDARQLSRYPEPTALLFRRIAAKLHEVYPEQIIATRGGDELLRLLFTTCMNPGDSFGMTTPGYSLYPALAAVQDCKLIEFPLCPDFALPADLAQQMNRQQISLTCLSNPHAPSGTYFTREKITAFLDQFEGLLLLDEAYVDFVDPDLAWSSIDLLRERDNLVLLRSLSKGYSLAGLRFGYGIGPQDLIQAMLEKTRDSYNLDLISQALACVAIGDQQHVRQNWQLLRRNRVLLTEELQKLGFRVAPSEGNYLLALVPEGQSAEQLYLALKRQKILVRWFREPRISQALRITVGTDEENARLIQYLTQFGADSFRVQPDSAGKVDSRPHD